MQDSRYPNLRFIGAEGFGEGGSPLPVPYHVEQMLRRVAKRVTSRVPGIRCAYDVRRKDIGFYYRNPGDGTMGGPFAERIYDRTGNLKNLDAMVDRFTKILDLGRVPRKVKDAWEESNRKSQEAAEQAATRSVIRERVQAAGDKLESRRRGRVSVVAGGENS